MQELEGLTRRFFTEIEVLVGPEKDIPAPDVNTNAQIMAWMMDTYSMHAGYTVPGVVTGKPISLGGSEGRNEATARGTRLLHRRGGPPPRAWTCRSRAVAVQGFGNAGSIAARLICDEGATVVAVSDSTGGIHNPAGLDIAKVIAWKQEHGTVQGFPGATDITNAEVLEVDCDILIPAALENQITEPQRRATSRPGSSPRPPTARRRPRPTRSCSRTAKFMIPDILCNAGGVTVSYFEWVQDLNRDHWSEAVVNAKLKEIMVKAFQRDARHRSPRAVQHADGGLPARRQARRGRHGDARPLPVEPTAPARSHEAPAGPPAGASSSSRPGQRRRPSDSSPHRRDASIVHGARSRRSGGTRSAHTDGRRPGWSTRGTTGRPRRPSQVVRRGAPDRRPTAVLRVRREQAQ